MPIGLQIRMTGNHVLISSFCSMPHPFPGLARNRRPLPLQPLKLSICMSLSDSLKQVCWTMTLLNELFISTPPVTLYGDNMGSIFLV